MTPRLNERGVVAVQPDLHGPIGCVWNDDTNRVALFENLTALVRRDPRDETIKRGIDSLALLPRHLGLRLVHLFLGFGQVRFRFGNVAYCTDTNGIPEESWPLLEGLDVLILDALRDRPHATHFSVEEALAVIQRVKPKQTFLTHISHELDHEATCRRLPNQRPPLAGVLL